MAHKGRLQTENKLPQPRGLHKKGGTAGDGDREGLGWPPPKLALLFVLPELQSTTIPPLLRKARGRKEEGEKTTRMKERYQTRPPARRGEAQTENKLPRPPCLRKKGGNFTGRRSGRTRVATLETRTAFSPS